MSDAEFRTMIMEQLLAIREDIGTLKGRSAVWGAVAGGVISLIGFVITLFNK